MFLVLGFLDNQNVLLDSHKDGTATILTYLALSVATSFGLCKSRLLLSGYDNYLGKLNIFFVFPGQVGLLLFPKY